MDFYEADTPAVYHAGTRVTGHTATAAGLARQFGTVLTTAETSVGHSTVMAAITRYHETWQPYASRVVGEVEALGVNTSGAAVAVDTADHDAGGYVRTTGGTVDAHGSTLRRDINGATGV